MIRRAAPLALGTILLALLAGCASVPDATPEAAAAAPRPAHRVFAEPLADALRPETLPPRSVEQGAASWYGPGFEGRRTASGETFNSADLTAAHNSLPMRTLARVTRVDTGVSVLVRINDRGPFAGGRIIDLSRAAAEALGMVDDGVVEVQVEDLGPADAEDRAAPTVFPGATARTG